MGQAAAIDAVMRTLADPTRRAVFERVVKSYGVFWRQRFTNLRSLLKEMDP